MNPENNSHNHLVAAEYIAHLCNSSRGSSRGVSFFSLQQAEHVMLGIFVALEMSKEEFSRKLALYYEKNK